MTIDVVDMYNSIPHSDGIRACEDALSRCTDYSPSQVRLILDLISLVLTNNCFQFEDRFFRQIRGTAMGSPFAPAYANIFMAHLWSNSIAASFPPSRWMKRYIDDIILIFPSSVDETSLLANLNSCHPTVKFTASPPSKSVAFLDIVVSICDSTLETDLYSKPTDSHRFLSPSSCHPGHVFRSIVYSGALRIRRICSRDDDFITRIGEFRAYLRSSGYSSKFIDPIIQKVSHLNRIPLLSHSNSVDQSDRTIFVTTYDPRMFNVYDAHSKHKSILSSSSRMSSILPANPLVAMKRPANLGNILIKTRPSALETSAVVSTPSLPFGHHPCGGDGRCLICKSHLVPDSKVTSTKTGIAYPIKHHLSCNSVNVIYSLTCSKCPFQYIGKTTTTLRQRFNFHKSTIRGTSSCDPSTKQPCPVASHFRLPNHDITDVRIQAIEKSPIPSLAKTESKWMHLLKCHRSVGGPNIDEPYLNGLLRSLNN